MVKHKRKLDETEEEEASMAIMTNDSAFSPNTARRTVKATFPQGVSTGILRPRKKDKQKGYFIEMNALNESFFEFCAAAEDIHRMKIQTRSRTNFAETAKFHYMDQARKYIKTAQTIREKYLARVGVMMCGSGDCGQLALSENTLEASTPREVHALRNSKAVSIACGGLHTAVVFEDGTVDAWGCNDEGSVGVQSVDTAFFPMRVNGFVPSAFDGYVAKGLQKVSTWKDVKQDVSDPNKQVPHEYEDHIKETAAGDCQTLFLSSTGRMYMTGAYKDKEGKAWRDVMPPDDPRTIHPKENKRDLPPPTGSQDWPIHLWQMPGKVLSFDCGASFNAAVVEIRQSDGSTKTKCVTWGIGEAGELARNAYTPIKNPDFIYPEDKSIEVPPYDPYFVDKVKDEHLLPQEVEWADGDPANNRIVVGVACGSFHLLVIAKDGEDGDLAVYSSGLNNYGQLGLGTEGEDEGTDKLTRITSLDGCNISKVAGGIHHSTCLDASGKNYYTWGRGDYGQLGNTDTVPPAGYSVLVPQRIDIADDKEVIVSKISSGGNHCMLLTEDAEVYTWGYGDLGALGHGKDEDVFRPKKLDVLKGVNRRRKKNNEPLLETTVIEVVGGGQHSGIIGSTRNAN